MGETTWLTLWQGLRMLHVMRRINGRFYFKQTSNGNLIGEWSNYECEPSTESSDLQDEYCPAIPFVGTYNSTWQENGVAIFAELKITKKMNSKKYCLDWKDQNKADCFKGEAMLCDNTLIGDYVYCGKWKSPWRFSQSRSKKMLRFSVFKLPIIRLGFKGGWQIKRMMRFACFVDL